MMKNVKHAVQVFAIFLVVVQPSLGMPRWLSSILSPALECVDSGAADFDNFMDTFIRPSTAVNSTTERFQDFPVGPGSDFYQQQQHYQQAVRHLLEDDQDDEFTVPECFYDMPVAINTLVPTPTRLQTIEETEDENFVEDEDAPRVTASPNITVPASPEEQQVAGHEVNGAAFEPDNSFIAQTNTNIELYLPEHILDLHVDLENRTITVENCWYSKFPLFLGVILLLFGVMFDCPEAVGGGAGAGAGAGGVVHRDLVNHTPRPRVTGPPLALGHDVHNNSTRNSGSGSGSGSSGSSGSNSSNDMINDNNTGRSIFSSIAGILSDMGQSLVNVFGLDNNIGGTLPETVSGRIATR